MGALEERGIVDDVLFECGSDSGSGSEPESNHVIEDAVRTLLLGLGEDCEREGIKKTPLRVAKAFKFGTKGYKQNVEDIVEGALFPESGVVNATGYAGGVGGLVVVRDINLFSYCESCLLPFSIQCHVGYVPSAQRVVGLSKLSRVADVFSRRLQEPKRLANEICSALDISIKPSGVAVALNCYHIQLPESLKCSNSHPSKDNMQGWVRTFVSSACGVLREDAKNSFWDEFVALLKFSGVNMDKGAHFQPWCPSSNIEPPTSNGHSKTCSKSGVSQKDMISSVSSIIQSLGEDPLREELVHTPYRYTQWLMNFKRSILEPRKNGSTFGGVSLTKKKSGFHYELNLPVCSQCEHHLLPFYGVVHVAYFGENEREVIARSFIQSVVHFYGCKLQVQERLTKQIAESIYSVIDIGVMVVVEANHICMISRGIEKVGSSTATIAAMGRFSTDRSAKALFLQNISVSTASGI